MLRIYPSLMGRGQRKGKTMKKHVTTITGFLMISFLLQTQAVFAQEVTMYAPDGRTLAVNQAEIGAYEAVGWYREPPYLMYAPDGRTLYVLPSEIGAYEAVGWYREPVRYMYAADGRVLVVPEREVEAHQNVGWFISREEAYYNGIIESYNWVMSVQDYGTAMEICENALAEGIMVENGIFYSDIAAKRRLVADTWRNTIRCPVGIIGYYMSENSIGTPEAHITFRNLSYQPITAFKLTFDCYDAFGNPSRWTSYSSHTYNGYVNNLYFEPMDSSLWYWTLYLQESTTNIRNIRITEIVFADGSKWVG